MIAPLPPAVESIYHNGAQNGERNTQLFKLACQFRDSGLSEFDAVTEAEIWGMKVGLSQNEAVAAVKSAYSKPPREPYRPKAKYSFQNGAIIREDLPVPPMPISVESGPVDKFLANCFDVGDSINICRSIKDKDGREKPDGAGENRTREEWLEIFKGDGLKEWQGNAVGVYVSINSNNGNGRASDHITKYRHCLVEFDESTLQEQWSIIKKSGLPTSAIIKSGARSLHAWVDIRAANAKEFAERVAFIYKHLEHTKLDVANKDAGRLSRLPGAMRTATGLQQELVECGAPTLTYMEWQERTMNGDLPEPFTWEQLINFKEDCDPTQLLGKRWICRGGSALWVGSSGLGKSVLCLQAAITWACGRDLFGISPHGKRLKSLIVQAENDEGDVAEALQGILRALDLTDEELGWVKANIVIVRDCTSTGERFVDRMRRLAEKHKPDLAWVDPLLAFIGGDLSSQETAGGFLRNLLNPLALSANFAWMLVHHTPKPTRDGSGYQGHDKAYSGFGSSELTNWARSVLTLTSCGQNEEGNFTYKLEVSKRGKRSGMRAGVTASDLIASKTQPAVHLKHADQGMAWIETVTPEKKKPGPKAPSVDWGRCGIMPCSWADLVRWVKDHTNKSQKSAERYVEEGRDDKLICVVDGKYQLKGDSSDQPF
jgi:RecA-family ATPase